MNDDETFGMNEMKRLYEEDDLVIILVVGRRTTCDLGLRRWHAPAWAWPEVTSTLGNVVLVATSVSTASVQVGAEVAF